MATTYRFLPWARRGLAAALPEPAPASPPGTTPAMPVRAEVAVRVVVSGGVGDVTTSALLHGPGDVIGLDPAQVVRMYPLPGTSNAEPNYLACVDFDAPELPWLFTPLGVPGTQHLPPWLVLVVVEHRDGVSVDSARGWPPAAAAHRERRCRRAAEPRRLLGVGARPAAGQRRGRRDPRRPSRRPSPRHPTATSRA